MSQERKPKTQQTIGVEHLKAFLKEHNITESMLSKTLGLSHGVVAKWIKTGKAPKWSQIAVEGLTRRTRVANAQPKFYLVECPPDKTFVVESFLNATNTKFTKV